MPAARKAWLLLLPLALSLPAACSSDTTGLPPACTGNTDCREQEVCVWGFCLPACTTSADCPGSLQCISGVCLEGCSDDSDCPELYACQGGYCRPQGGSDGGSDAGDGSSDGGGDGGGDAADGGQDGGGEQDPCEQLTCPPHQHCEVNGGSAACVDNSCDDLQCGPSEECQPGPQGGALCVDISCSSDIDCPPERFCDGSLCRDDTCQAGCRRCSGTALQQCTANGGGFVAVANCGSDAYFDSQCVDGGDCAAHCTCRDDWDCPAYMSCEAGTCQGTGREPTCRLEPQPFDQVLPTPEITWGGDAADPTAAGSPFPEAAQVVMTPLVANLDDDNGDGLIDERDIPEIVFLSFRNHDFTRNGVLRAIHGGGPERGQDYFAVCGSKVWHQGDDLGMACSYDEADIDSTTSLAVGDLDGDGVPEIVAVSENDAIHIYDNRGDIMSVNAAGSLGAQNPAVSLVNVDGLGLAEIVVGRVVYTLEADAGGALRLLDRFEGTRTVGKNGQGPISCPADLDGDGRAEIVAGTVAYRMPRPPAGVTRQSECSGNETDPEEVAFCQGELLVFWDGPAVNPGAIDANHAEGFCAVADVLGADPAADPGPSNPLDGQPEVLVIANGRLFVLSGADGTLRRDIDLQDGFRGGAPNVDDFDGDGFPELGTAFETRYIMYDFQSPSPACPAWPEVLVEGQPPPAGNPARQPGGDCTDDADCTAGEAVCNRLLGRCTCLHNGWQSRTEDDSSRVTGSSVFDFNGDGAAEVIYNDECRFRVYDGSSGAILFSEPSESRTRVEYPVVADVDNDGNAEIVFCTTTESGFCSENLDGQYNAGIEVWGDASDTWVSARRIWNQHAYHVTNVTEAGAVPGREPENWHVYNGRAYNTYRSNPRSYAWGPDLTPTGMQFTSPGSACGELSLELDITLAVANQGDLRVGPGVEIAFTGTWQDIPLTEPLLDSQGDPLTIVLQNNIAPGSFVLVGASYHAANNSPGRLPDEITASVDAAGAERECREDNNIIAVPVTAGEQAADLRLELGAIDDSFCPTPSVETTVYNDGSLPAAPVVVRYYAGDPDQGGSIIHEEQLDEPLLPGQSVSFTAYLSQFPMRLVTVWAVVDPDDLVFECNDGNNRTQGGQVWCGET